MLNCNQQGEDGSFYSSGNDTARIGFVGDVLFGELLENFGRGVRTRIEKHGMDPFEFCRNDFFANDLNVANLECVLSVSSNRKGIFKDILRAPSSYVAKLVEVPIHVVSIANNHALDHGRQALMECVGTLRDHGIRVVGMAGDRLRQEDPEIIMLGGLSLAFWSFNLANLTPEEFAERSAWVLVKAQESVGIADKVVMLMHWGEEYTSVPPSRIYRLGKEMADCGVSVICGHHSHRIQGVTTLDECVFAPSLGNFIFDDRRRESTLTSMLQVTLKAGESSEWRSLVYSINSDFQPVPDSGRAKELYGLNQMLSQLIGESEAGDSHIDDQIAERVARGHRFNRFRMRGLMLRHILNYRSGYCELISHMMGKDRVPFSVSDSSEWS